MKLGNIFHKANSTNISQFFFHALSFFLIRGIPFVSVLIVAQLLGIEKFGRFSAAINFFLSLLLFVDIGLSIATTSLVAKRNMLSYSAACRMLTLATLLCLVLSIIMSLLLYWFAEKIAFNLFHGDTKMQRLLVIGALYIPATSMFSVIVGGLQGFQRYQSLTLVGLIGGTAYAVIVVTFSLPGDAELAVWGASIGFVVRFVIVAYAARNDLVSGVKSITPVRLKFELVRLARVALPISIAGLITAPTGVFLYSQMFLADDGATQAGAYGLAFQVFTIVMVLPSILTQFALPKLSEYGQRKNTVGMNRIIILYGFYSIIVTLTFCVIIYLAAPFLTENLAKQFTDHVLVLSIFLLTAVVSAAQGVCAAYLVALGGIWSRIIPKAMFAVVIFLAMHSFIDKSAVNAALAFLLGTCAMGIIQLGYVFFVNIKYQTS